MATVVTGPADLRAWAEQSTRLADVAVRLPEMHAVGAKPLRQSHAVVDDERDVGVSADSVQRFGKAGELMLLDLFNPQLESRRDARLERCLEAIRERAADVLRADQVQRRRRRPLRRREIDRIELSVVQDPAGTLSVEAS